jgi:hypothetical protein
VPKFWLDADALIEPSKGAYGLDIAPAFWIALDDHARQKIVRSSSMVYDEIAHGGDALAEWVRDRKDMMFEEPGTLVQAVYKQIATWVERTYGQPHSKTFLGGADAWIIAHAKVDKATVVSFEKPRPPQQGARPKIPSVCQQFDVPCVDLYAMQRDLNIRWT